MRKYILSILFLTGLTFSATAQGYEIKVKVNGIKDTVAYLANYFGKKQFLQDTARIDSQGIAIFTGEEALPQGIYIFYSPAFTSVKTFDFIIEKDQSFSLSTDTANFNLNMQTEGSEENKYWFDYIQFISQKEQEIRPLKEEYSNLRKEANPLPSTKKDLAKIEKKIQKIDKEVIEYKHNFIDQHSNTFVAKLFQLMEDPKVPEAAAEASNDSLFAFKYFKGHYLDHLDLGDDRFLRTPLFHKKIDYYLEKLTSPEPDSIIAAADYLLKRAKANKEVYRYLAWYFTSTYGNSKIMGQDAIFVHIAENYYLADSALQSDSAYIEKLKERVSKMKPVLIGKKAPNAIFSDSNDQHIQLHDIKANYTVLVFWDSDCGHCQKELPLINKSYLEMQKAQIDVKIIAVCTELEKDEWLTYLKGKNYNWIHTQDPYGERRKYDILSTPSIFILDKNKKIIAKKLKGEYIKEFIEFHENKLKKGLQ